MSTTVVASVLDPAGFAVSAIRTTSPPMLLGRKLLKKVATKNDEARNAYDSRTCCARSRTSHRHVLASTIAKYNSSAAPSHATDACRATLQRRAMSTRENSSASNPMLIVAFAAVMMMDRARRGRAGLSKVPGVFMQEGLASLARMLQLPVSRCASS